MINLREMLEEWHETKSLATAYDICEALYEEMVEADEPELA